MKVSWVIQAVFWLPVFSQSLAPAQVQAVDGDKSVMLPRTELTQSLSNEAEAAGTQEGLNDYVYHLIKVSFLVPNGETYYSVLSHRLAMAEVMTRDGKRKLISEATIANAFNDLMKQVENTSTPKIQTDTSTVHKHRIALHNTSAALSTVDKHKTECFPTEAVLLLFMLINNDGNFGFSDVPKNPGVFLNPRTHSAKSEILEYSSTHSHFDSIKLYDGITNQFGF